MRQGSQFEAAVSRFARLSPHNADREAVDDLRMLLRGRSSLPASVAAETAGRCGLKDLIPDLIGAFKFFAVDGASVDKLCSAKIAIVNALNELEYLGEEVFFKGVRCVQMEPVYGGQVDTAVKVRSGCAYGLARIEHPDVVPVLTDLLVDPEAEVRAAAVRALSYIGCLESEALLRLKAMVGDKEPDVVRECFEGLLVMAPERSLDFVARFLRSPDSAVAQYAALAIAGTHLPRAFDILRGFWDDTLSPSDRRMLLLPIALVRLDEALDFLVHVVRTADLKTAAEAVSALQIYSAEKDIRRIREAVESRGDAELRRTFDREIGRG